MRLPWGSQWESAVALESDEPRCCIFSRSAKDHLASRSCPAPSRLCYLLVSSALCSPWFSPEKAYPQCMLLSFRYVCSSPLRHPHRLPAPILILSSVVGALTWRARRSRQLRDKIVKSKLEQQRRERWPVFKRSTEKPGVQRCAARAARVVFDCCVHHEFRGSKILTPGAFLQRVHRVLI